MANMNVAMIASLQVAADDIQGACTSFTNDDTRAVMRITTELRRVCMESLLTRQLRVGREHNFFYKYTVNRMWIGKAQKDKIEKDKIEKEKIETENLKIASERMKKEQSDMERERPFGKYTNMTYIRYPGSRAKEVQNAYLTKEAHEKQINMLQAEILSQKEVLAHCHTELGMVNFETSFIIDYLGGFATKDVISALEHIDAVRQSESEILKKMHNSASKIVELVHLLRVETEACKERRNIDDKTQKLWADAYDEGSRIKEIEQPKKVFDAWDMAWA